MVAGNVLFMFVDFSGSTGTVLEVVVVLPVPLQEIALALWLIFKGFDSSPDQTGIDLTADRPTISI